jgi:hypothetical protein
VRFAAALLLVLASASAWADDPTDWYLQVDNDVVFHTDRWYSSGLRVARLHGDVEVGLVQEIYTPDVQHSPLGAPEPAPTARLLATIAQHFRGESAYQTVGAAAGVRGPSALGEQTQRAVHRLVPSGANIDWTHQPRPNKFDGEVQWTRTQRSAPESPMAEGLKIHFGAIAGNTRIFAHLGAEYRVGSATARGLSSPLLRYVPTPPITDSGARPLGWSAFAGGSLRGVARNELIGPDYDPTKPELKALNAVGRFAIGATYGWRSAAIEFAVAHDTREFSGQHTGQSFGSLTLRFTF